MRTTIIIALVLGAASPAFAWDGPGMWYRAADDANPGGGGIIGTGGAHDHGIKCTDCHVDRVAEPNLAFAMTFAPVLPATGYAPNQRYTVTAKFTNALLGVGCNAQDPNMHNNDSFAASFENDAGAPAGSLASDSGGTSTSCRLPSPPPPGTTAMDGDCQVVFSHGDPDRTTWTFNWTAPASGPVHIYWGAVDGNCDMMSMKDAAVTGSMTLAMPPTAAAVERKRFPWHVPLIASGLIGLVLLPRRFRRA